MLNKAFSNPKFFGAFAVLFAVSTFINTTGFQVEPRPAIQASPTMPPDPWTEPPVQKASPTMPPDPWTEPPVLKASPTMPPDPWTEPPVNKTR
jgi:hypothetical protein